MKTIFAFLAAVAFDAIAFTYLYLTDNGGLFTWVCALLMILLTFSIAMMHEPKKFPYPWFISYVALNASGQRQFGRLLTYTKYKHMTYTRVMEMEEHLNNMPGIYEAQVRNYYRLKN